MLTGCQHGDSPHGVGVPDEDSRDTHPPPVLGVRRDVLRVQAAPRREDAEENLLPRREHGQPSQAHLTLPSAEEVRRNQGGVALLQVDRQPEQSAPDRERDEAARLHRPGGDTPTVGPTDRGLKLGEPALSRY